MCGIAGLVRWDGEQVSRSLIEGFNSSLLHRGPDDLGFLGWSPGGNVSVSRDAGAISASTILIHRRLSIIDLAQTGWQPMRHSSGRYHIVYNGEVYNYPELRKELEALGEVFHSQSDTEVVMAAVVRWGAAALTRFKGMFAFALLDHEKRSLFLARDFFGIKPLYYAVTPSGFSFASEIKTLLLQPQLRRGINPQRFYNYLRFGVTDNNDDTFFAGISQLPPAHCLEIKLDQAAPPRPVRYWAVTTTQDHGISLADATAEVKRIFLDNVRLHLRSDVPIGSALSGGIDSSAVVMAVRRLNGEQADVRTFSYLADDPSINEEKWMDCVVRAARTKAFKVMPSAGEMVADLDKMVAHLDEPFGSTSCYAQFRVFKLAAENGIKVMLDGQGADEILAGYPPYLSARLASLIRCGHFVSAAAFARGFARLPGVSSRQSVLKAAALLVPNRLQSLLRGVAGYDLHPNWLEKKWFEKQGVTPQIFWMSGTRQILKEKLLESLTQTSLPLLLRHEDRLSMAFSVESRVPFLTPELVNFLYSLPEEYLLSPQGTSKHVFRQAMRGLVPDEILDRKDKIGFATPEGKWLKEMRGWVEGVLESETARGIPAFSHSGLRQEWSEVCEGRRPFDSRVWRWLNVIRWAELNAILF